nr:transcriptional activator [Caulobacter vibrioides]
MAWHRNIKTRGAMVVAAVTLGACGVAAAQSMSTNSASFNAGYGRSSGQESRMVEYSTRDANGNRVVVDGVMLTGSDQSVFSSSRSSGSLDAYSGVGAVGGYAGSTAIGNNLTVITQGNNNTVIVIQPGENSGNVTAGANVVKGGTPK